MSPGDEARRAPAAERHATAGPRALAAMSALLGLKPGGAWTIEGLCASGEPPRLRASLRGGGAALVFHVLPPGAPESSVRAPGLSLAAEGAAGPAALRFLAAAAARLGARTPADLARLIDEDPRSFVESVPAAEDGDRVKVPCIGQPMELLEAGWRNFYADQDFEVLLGVPQCSKQRTVNIEYADLECYYARPKRSFRKWTFLDWPEESEPDGGADTEDGAGGIETELEERDMIMGTGERADALVEEVRKRAKKGDYLLFTHLCTPIIMGEDFAGLARRCEREVGGISVSWSQKDRDSNDNFGDHFRALLARPGFFDVPDDPLAVNLFHFPKPCREDEIEPFLSEVGLRVNMSAFPDVRFAVLDDLPKARWQVFCERSSYPTKVHEMLAASPRPVVRVAAPYGLAGSRECLRGIAAAAGREKEFEAAWARRMEGFLPRWEEMRREAAGRRLAFVVSEATLPRLLSLRYGYGAPLATMALEMGFGVDLVWYDRHAAPPSLPTALAGARVTAFRSPWELERALGEGDSHAVFSDVAFDWRVTRAGKARFGSRDFEMGVEGARRTFEKLLSVCRLPFYRRYAAHLAKGRPEAR